MTIDAKRICLLVTRSNARDVLNITTQCGALIKHPWVKNSLVIVTRMFSK